MEQVSILQWIQAPRAARVPASILRLGPVAKATWYRERNRASARYSRCAVKA